MMNSMKKILIILIILFLFNCEKTMYEIDFTDPEFLQNPTPEVTDSSATITWITNEACSCRFEYSLYINKYQPDTIVIPEFRENHIYSLHSLWPDVKYYCLIELYDFEDNGPVISDTIVFSTHSNLLSRTWSAINDYNITGADSLIGLWGIDNYESPRTHFTKAWINFKKGEINLAKDEMLEIYYNYPDFLPNIAALAVINHLESRYDDALECAETIIEKNNYFQFVYKETDLNYKFLRLIMAESYLVNSNINKCYQQIDILWPDNNLDSNIPDTWQVEGVTYDSYTTVLVAAINYLYKIL